LYQNKSGTPALHGLNSISERTYLNNEMTASVLVTETLDAASVLACPVASQDAHSFFMEFVVGLMQ
jgi:hypothetical protein